MINEEVISKLAKEMEHCMTEHERTYISVSDKTSRAALHTFEKIRKDTK